MNTFVKGAVLALALAGTSFVTASTAVARDNVGVYIGPSGVHLSYQERTYYDRHHHRQSYRYPSDYRSYHHSRGWYRYHQNWHDERHSDWYRR